MRFISSRELSKKWNISQRRIVRLAGEGRIEGARMYGKSWLFPDDVPKPADGRTKEAKASLREDVFFRYPVYENTDNGSFSPHLSEDELCLKHVAECFYACRFEDADRMMGSLPEKSDNKYLRICALYEGCMIDLFLCNTTRFFIRCNRLRAELKEDFPHKVEMQEYLYKLDATLGSTDYYKNGHRVIPGYPYHESFLPHLSSLCSVSLSFANEVKSPVELRAHEMNCIYLEQTNAYVDIQAIHVSLGAAYALCCSFDEMTYHFKKALELADRYQMYYGIAVQYYYLRKLISPIAEDFSPELRKTLDTLSNEIHRRYILFMDKISADHILKLIKSDDSVYLYYAVQGLTNKEIAKLLNVSEGSIGKRFSDIYAQLNVSSKGEMIRLYHRSVSGKTGKHIL